jgi:hypothetical protein
MKPRSRHASLQFMFALALGLVAPAGAAAQTVVGTVVDQSTLHPIVGAFVTLDTPDGQRHRGVLTGPEGRFVLRASEPGPYHLTAQMIGYASPPSERVELQAGATVERTIQVPVQAITLDGISVASGARCRPRPGSGPETARLWEEARKALEVARWAEQTSAVRFRGVRYERTLDGASLRVLASAEQGWGGWFSSSPYASLPVEELTEGGYVRSEADGTLVYYGPDASVLLSDLFLDTHCFYVRPGAADEAHLIGLAFEPVRRGRLPDVRGVLWLDRGTAELRRLDFDYTHLPSVPAQAWGAANGLVEFERLATGVWIIRRWRIRMPVVELRSVLGRQEAVVATVQEGGGEVRNVLGSDGRPLAESGGATLFGVVTDSATGEPLRDVLVDVVAAGRTATTGEDGAFRIAELGSGLFEVQLTRRDGDLGLTEPARRLVELEGGRAARLAAALPPPPAPPPPAPADPTPASERVWRNALLGLVVQEDTREPVSGALVRVLDETGSVAGSAVTDARGQFRINHPDRGAEYVLRVEHVAFAPAVGPIRFDRSDQVRVEVVLATRAIELDPIVVTERRRGALAEAGFYERQARGRGVFVEMDDARRQRTSRLTDLLAGQSMVRLVNTGPFRDDVRIAATERMSETGFRDCQPAIYLDGAIMRRAGDPRDTDPVLNDVVGSEHIAGIEVFRRATEVPIRFAGAGAACGVILIWTR